MENRLSPERRVETLSFVLALAGVAVGVALDSQIGPCLIGLACLLYIVSVIKYRAIEGRVSLRIVLAIVLTCIGVWWLEGKIASKELEDDEGLLVSAGLPTPLSTCPIPVGSFGVYLASSAYVATGHQSIIGTLNQNQSMNKELLAVSSENNGFAIDAVIFDDRQNLVAKLEHNHFIRTPYAAYKKRPDKSTLIIYDHLDREVLNIQIVNDHSVLVRRADIYTPDGKHHVRIDGDVMLLDGGSRGSVYHNCYSKMRNIVAILP